MKARVQTLPKLAIQTLDQAFLEKTNFHREKIAYRFMDFTDNTTDTLKRHELLKRVTAVAAKLQIIADPEDRAVLLYPPGLGFIEGFYGCILSRIIAVPAYPPTSARNISRILKILSDSAATIILTDKKTKDLLDANAEVKQKLGKLKIIATDEIDNSVADEWRKIPAKPDDIAFLQYTSGSTGNPKGVMVSHLNIMTNVKMIEISLDYDESSEMVSWLPVFHDMGLIGCILTSLVVGFPCTFTSPLSFLEKPFRWLKMITDFRATCSGGPNFAFELCTKKISDSDMAQLDLSSIRTLFNGAEPVKPDTLTHFSEKFRKVGFDASAIFPCYGMAESTLIISGGPRGAKNTVLEIDRDSLEQGKLQVANSESVRRASFVSCGIGFSNQDLRIVNPQTLTQAKEFEIGEIWVKGPHIAKGYWRNEAATNENFMGRIKDSMHEGFLRTGDLGFLYNDELFIAGRHKDLVILNGVNYYPQDLEETIERTLPQAKKGSTAAFAIEEGGGEHLAIVIEVDKSSLNADFDALSQQVIESIMKEHEIVAKALFFTKPGQSFRTSSGKIQRRATKQAVLGNELELVYKWTRNPILHEERVKKDEKRNVQVPLNELPSEEKKPVPPAAEIAAAIRPPARNPITIPPPNLANEREETLILDDLKVWFSQEQDCLITNLDFDRSFSAYGIDSIGLTALQVYLDGKYNYKLTQDFIYEGGTAKKLAKEILKKR